VAAIVVEGAAAVEMAGEVPEALLNLKVM